MRNGEAAASEAEGTPAPVPSIPVVPTSVTSSQVIATLLLVAALDVGEGFFAPVTLAILASIALVPPVRWLSRLMPRALAAAVVVLAIAGLAVVTAYSLTDEAAGLVRELPGLVRQVRQVVTSASPREGVIRQLQQAVSELERSTQAPAVSGTAKVTIVEPTDVQWGVMAGTRRGAEVLGEVVLLLFFVYFLLASGDLFRLKFVKLGGERLSQKKVTVQMMDEITTLIGRFVFYQAWSGALVGVLTWLSFSALGVRYAGLWGLAAGLLNAVPYFGPTIVMAGSAVAALIQFRSLGMVATVAVVSIAITSIEGFGLAPWMLGRAARVNTVATFLSLMFWGWLWGAIGLIVAVPILMVMKTVADRVESLSAWSELLSDGRS